MERRIIVTGATSFIGAITVKQLLLKGCTVCAVVRPNSQSMDHLNQCIPNHKKDNLIVLCLDLEQIGQLSQCDLPGSWDWWVHIGWEGAGSYNRTNSVVQKNNVHYGLEAIKMAKTLGCKRFLFTGSQAEYGVHQTVLEEDMTCHPISEYGKAKLEFGNQGKELCKTLEIEYIHTRIFSVYGPGDHPWSLVNTCLNTWQGGNHMELGACTQKWNFLFVEDAVEAILSLLEAGRPGIYNVAGEDTRVLREFIEEMYEACGSKGGYTYGVRQPNAEGLISLIPDITKLKTETDWHPRTSFKEGIHETMYCLQEETTP